jgi:uncharacterized membrane protein HdeD (DUF308 family)
MSVNQTPASPHPSLGKAIVQMRHKWGWFLAFGIITALFGLAALVLVVSSTIASVFMIAIFMCIAGGVEIGIGFNARTWGWKAIWILVGLLYIVSGALALAQPLLAAAFFTLVLGISLAVTGILRIVAGLQLEPGHKAAVVLAGVVTTLLGVMIVAGWPASSLIVLGTFLGIDLLFYGMSWIFFSLRLRTL